MSRMFPSPAIWASLEVPLVTATVREPDTRLLSILLRDGPPWTREEQDYVNRAEQEAL